MVCRSFVNKRKKNAQHLRKGTDVVRQEVESFVNGTLLVVSHIFVRLGVEETL
jgi:hypothetical protein